VLWIPFTYDLRPTAVLKELYVAEDSHSEGLGQPLMHAVAEWAFIREAGRLKWDVLMGNQPAIRF
jgi:GNAT superfamily N-acetyltransferase